MDINQNEIRVWNDYLIKLLFKGHLIDLILDYYYYWWISLELSKSDYYSSTIL